MHAYVYYKTHVSDELQVRHCITGLQELCVAQGLAFQVQKKVQANAKNQAELHTWMEIYTSICIDDGACEMLEQLAHQSGLYSFIQGTRHVELFEDVALCV